MSTVAIGIWSIPVFLLMTFLRAPIGLAMLICGPGGSWPVTGSPGMALSRLKTEVFGAYSNYSLSIVPMFLLMGYLAGIGGISRSLFKAAEAFLGHRKGGTTMVAIGTCAGFGAICGSSLATAATMGWSHCPSSCAQAMLAACPPQRSRPADRSAC